MKLFINFQIKDGKRIISHSTVGYKVFLNKIKRTFDDISDSSTKDITVIIQTSANAAKNNRGKYYATCGKYDFRKMQIVMFAKNCEDHNQMLNFLAHEFGHLFHYLNDYVDWTMTGILDKEKFADQFAVKITGVNPQSITGKVRSIAAMKRSR